VTYIRGLNEAVYANKRLSKLRENIQELVSLETISSGATIRRVPYTDIPLMADLLQQTAKFIQEY